MAAPALLVSPAAPAGRAAGAAGLQVRFIRLGGADLSALAPLRAWLPAAELQRLARLRRPGDQRRFLVAHAALRGVLGQLLALPPTAVPIQAAPGGKPVLRGAGAALHFSLSHAGGWVALAWTAEGPVGIDAEAAVPWFGELLPACATASEQAAIRDSEHPAGAFLRLWTAKEAVLKAHGGGLAVPMAGIALAPADAQGWQRATLAQPPSSASSPSSTSSTTSPAPARLRVRALDLDGHHAAAVALADAAGAGPGLPDTGAPAIALRRLEAAALTDPDFSWSLLQ